MRRNVALRFAIAVFGALALVFGGGPPSARGEEPLGPAFPFYASEAREPSKGGGTGGPHPLNGAGFEGPCGLAVDTGNNFYVADYYHQAVDVFSPFPKFFGLLLHGEGAPTDPCGLAVTGNTASGTLYVNDYHRDVVGFPLASGAFGAGTVIDSDHPTGVAVDRSTGNVYVNNRTYVSVYGPSGAPLLDEGLPLRIGLGDLVDGYGVAVSEADGRVYVADAGDDTVKIYDPGTGNQVSPSPLNGAATPRERFVSLRDSVLAFDQEQNLLYVVDDLGPTFSGLPEAAVYAFAASGEYAGRLKYNIVNARPAGLAVGGGRVYVTSGNSEDAAVYAYAAGALAVSEFPAPEGDGTLAPASPPAAIAAAPALLAAPLEPAGPAVAPGQSAVRVKARRGKRRLHRHRRHVRQRHQVSRGRR